MSVDTLVNPSASFTRPADTTTYAVGDLIANSTTAGSVVPMEFTVARSNGGGVSIEKMRMFKSGTGISGAAFQLRLYRESPTVSNGDNGAYLCNKAADFLGAFNFSLADMIVHTDGVACNGITSTGYPVQANVKAGQTKVYGLLYAAAAYAPTSAESFTFIPETRQD